MAQAECLAVGQKEKQIEAPVLWVFILPNLPLIIFSTAFLGFNLLSKGVSVHNFGHLRAQRFLSQVQTSTCFAQAVELSQVTGAFGGSKSSLVGNNMGIRGRFCYLFFFHFLFEKLLAA